jgi:hypothetical protein
VAATYKATVAGGIPLRRAGNVADTVTAMRPMLLRGDKVWVRKSDDAYVVEFQMVDGKLVTTTTNMLGGQRPPRPWAAAFINIIGY